jgi:hypothetical protein
MRTIRPALTLVALATAAALLAACGGDDTPAAAPASAASAPATTTAGGGGGGGGGGGAPIEAEEVEASTALRQIQQEVPGGMSLETAVRWTDSAGESVLVLSSGERPGESIDGDQSTTYALRADLFTTKDGTTRRVRTVNDAIESCQFDSQTQFADGPPEVTDADGDGLGEVTFGYSLGCVSDVSPVEFKLLALEGTDKYILRGETYTRTGQAKDSAPLIRTTAEPAFGSWPAGLQSEAERRWDAWTIAE